MHIYFINTLDFPFSSRLGFQTSCRSRGQLVALQEPIKGRVGHIGFMKVQTITGKSSMGKARSECHQPNSRGDLLIETY
jgi:hypothetical protein